MDEPDLINPDPAPTGTVILRDRMTSLVRSLIALHWMDIVGECLSAREVNIKLTINPVENKIAATIDYARQITETKEAALIDEQINLPGIQ